MRRIETYSVGELARAAGVTVRTLHHYDALGLLSPIRSAGSGYRVYTRAEALRLQEILFYRAAGMPLAEIGAVLADDNPVARLEAHRDRLGETLGETARMLAALDRTLDELKGGPHVPLNDLYVPLAAETQAAYEAWLVETYGSEMAKAVAASKARLARVTEGPEDRMQELREIETALVAAFEAGTEPRAADLAAHRAWVARMWGRPCDRAAHAGLAEMYLSHPDFIARYEALAPGFSQWLPAAMKAAAE